MQGFQAAHVPSNANSDTQEVKTSSDEGEEASYCSITIALIPDFLII